MRKMSVKVRFGTITNREMWIERMQVTDENGVPFDLSGTVVNLEVQYQPSGRRVISAANGDGQLQTDESGNIEWIIDVSRMRSLRPGLYNVGLVCRLEGTTRQILTGTIQIDSGYIS